MAYLSPTTSTVATRAQDSIASQPAARTPQPPLFNPADLVFHLDLLLAAIVACVVLFRAPRVFARFSRLAGWTHGHILHSARLKRPSEHRMSMVYHSHGIPSERGTAFASEISHSLYAEAYVAHRRKLKRSKYSYPVHVPSCPAIVRPLVPFLRRRLAPGFSVGQMLVLCVYFAILLYVTLVGSDPFTDPLRAGYVAMSQLPLVFALATKNGVAGIPLGLSYEKLNYLHRFAGRLLVLASNIHSLGYAYVYMLNGTFIENLKKPSNVWGWVALICTDVIFLFSTSFWRKNAYNVFVSTHVVSFCILLPAIYRHNNITLPYIAAAAGIYGFDHLLRLVKTRIHYARMTPIPELGMTRIEIPRLNSGWRAGQHVRIRVLSTGMGWFRWVETHPFTIASMSDSEDGVVLLCKRAGRWTSRLYEIAKADGYCEGGHGTGRGIKVTVEGPYGGPGDSVFASYSAAVFVVGGSGVSFALSAVQDLVHEDLQRASRVKVIELIWCVQDHASLTPFIPLFTSLIERSIFTPLRISVFYTRATMNPVEKTSFVNGLTLSPSRPRFGKILDAVVSRAVSLGSGVKDAEDLTGVIVGVCGPLTLGDEVAKAIGDVDVRRREAVGGIELHEEVFDW